MSSLPTWRCEQWITEFYRRAITPDGYGCWYQHGQWLGFFLEHDTGTEPLRRVADKLDRYTGGGRVSGDALDTARQLAGMVCSACPPPTASKHLRRALLAKNCPVAVATATRDAAPRTARRARCGPYSPPRTPAHAGPGSGASPPRSAAPSPSARPPCSTNSPPRPGR